jgi:hypothetical protein
MTTTDDKSLTLEKLRTQEKTRKKYVGSTEFGILKVYLHYPTECVVQHNFHRRINPIFCRTTLSDVARHNFD